jgi:methionine biosynthesis protein MetW
VLTELMRIAERAIVSFPNFGYWRVRLGLLTTGRMPTTKALPTPWWATPNIHLCTLRDFTDLVDELDLRVEASAALAEDRPARPMGASHLLENWRAESALFLLARKDAAPELPAERRAADRLL